MADASKRKIHHAIWIALGLCVIQCAAGVLISTVGSLFALPMSEALGVPRTAWMFWTTFYGIGCMVFSPIIGNLYANDKIPIKLLTTLFGLSEIIAIFLFALAGNVYMAYAAGLFFAFGEFALRSCAMPVFASNWFSGKYRGTALGVMNSANGVGGAVFPPIIQIVIASAGVFMGYMACAGLMALCILPWTLFVIVRKPEDIGLKPMGYKEGDAKASEKLKKDADLTLGIDARKALTKVGFYCLCIVSFALAINGGFKGNAAGMAVDFLSSMSADDAKMVGAFMLSIISTSDLIANLLGGWLTDRLGVFIPTLIFVVMTLAIFVFWIFMGNTTTGLYAGAFCFGFHGVILRVCLPQTTRALFGPKEFPKIWSRVVMWKGIMGGFASTVVAFFYDFGGGYMSALIFGLILNVVALSCMFFAIYAARKDAYHWKDGGGTSAPASV
jgi:MFS family permease